MFSQRHTVRREDHAERSPRRIEREDHRPTAEGAQLFLVMGRVLNARGQARVEVTLCRRSGILINTFMLARDRSLVEFVKKVSAICRGKAYFTNTMTLGQFILMDFMRRKTRRVS